MTWNLAQTMSLIKARIKKYKYRRPKPGGGYKYYYEEHHGGGITSAAFEAGSAFKLTWQGRRGHFHIKSIDGDMITISHDARPGVEIPPIHRDELRALLEKQHSKAETKSREKAQKRRKSAAKKRKSTKRQAPAKRPQLSVADQVEEHRGQLLDQAKALKERIEGLDKKKDKEEIARLRDEAGALSGAALLAQRAQRDGIESAGPMIQKQIEQTQRMIDRSDNAEHTARLTRDLEQKRKLLDIIEGKTQVEPERPKREKVTETAQQGADNFETMPEELPNEPFEMRIARENIGKVSARLKAEREKGKTERQLSMLNQMLESARRDYAAELAEYRAEQENPGQREAKRQAEREARKRERQEEETKRTQAREAAQQAEREEAFKGLSTEEREQISTVVSELDKTGGKILKVEKQGNGYLVTVDPFSALDERPKSFGFGRSRGSDIRSTTPQRVSQGHAADAETTAHVRDFGKRLKNIIKDDERFEDFHMVKRPKKKRVADGRSWYPVDKDEENHFVFEFETAQPTAQRSQTTQAPSTEYKQTRAEILKETYGDFDRKKIKELEQRLKTQQGPDSEQASEAHVNSMLALVKTPEMKRLINNVVANPEDPRPHFNAITQYIAEQAPARAPQPEDQSLESLEYEIEKVRERATADLERAGGGKLIPSIITKLDAQRDAAYEAIPPKQGDERKKAQEEFYKREALARATRHAYSTAINSAIQERTNQQIQELEQLIFNKKRERAEERARARETAQQAPQRSQTAQAFSDMVDTIKSGERSQKAQDAFKTELNKVIDKAESGTLTDAERAELLPVAEQLVEVTSGRARALMTAVRDQIKG